MPKRLSSPYLEGNEENEEDYYACEGGSVDSMSTDA